MTFIPYGRQWVDDDDIRAVEDVLRSDFLTQGPYVDRFEQALCDKTGAKYCVAVSSATAALHIAVASLGVGKGAEGITSPNTFLASANCLVYNGIKPVFADIDLRTYAISAANITKKISPHTRVVIPVHFAGQACDMAAIKKAADSVGAAVIEDAAHAIGSRYPDHSYVGNCGYSLMTVFSFHPVKTIATGEGGAITTNDKAVRDRLLMLRNHGMTKDPALLTQNPGPWYYEMQMLGFNYRMTDMQAALGLSQLKKLDMFVERRREIVSMYNKAFSGVDWLTTPYEKCIGGAAFHLYVLKIDFRKRGITRSEAMKALRDKGVGTQVHYIPVYAQPYYQKAFGYAKGACPVAEEYYENALSIPLYPKMTDEEVDRVIASVKSL